MVPRVDDLTAHGAFFLRKTLQIMLAHSENCTKNLDTAATLAQCFLTVSATFPPHMSWAMFCTLSQMSRNTQTINTRRRQHKKNKKNHTCILGTLTSSIIRHEVDQGVKLLNILFCSVKKILHIEDKCPRCFFKTRNNNNTTT